MKTDRELLEAAAKAAGIAIDKSPYNGGGTGNTGFNIMGDAVLDWHEGKTWNPLRWDGDALRLAVKLRLNVTFTHGLGSSFKDEFMQVVPVSLGHLAEFWPIGNDAQATVRRAIVCVAASIATATVDANEGTQS